MSYLDDIEDMKKNDDRLREPKDEALPDEADRYSLEASAKRERKTTTSREVLRTAKSFVVQKANSDTAYSIASKVMPDNLMHDLNKIRELKNSIKGLDYLKRETINLNNSAKAAHNNYRKILPSSINTIVDKVLKYRKLGSNSGGESYDADAEELSYLLSDVFDSGDNNTDRNDATTKITQNVALTGLYRTATAQYRYDSVVVNNWRKKILEIQFKQYKVQSNILSLMTSAMEKQDAQLEAIIKNTGLPDILKSTSSEKLKGQIGSRMYSSIADKLGEFRNNLLRNISGNINQKIGSSGMMMGTLAQVLQQYANEDTSNMTRTKLLTNIFMNEIASRSKGAFKGKIASKLKNTSRYKAGAQKYTDFRERLMDSYFLNTGDNAKTSTDNSFFGKLFRNNAMFLPTAGEKMKFNYARMDAEAPAMYDVAARESLVYKIPGYLSKILAEVTGIRTGAKAEELVYSRDRNQLITVSKNKEDVLNKLNSASDNKSIYYDIDQMARLLGLDGSNKELLSSFRKYMFQSARSTGYISMGMIQNDIRQGNPLIKGALLDFLSTKMAMMSTNPEQRAEFNKIATNITSQSSANLANATRLYTDSYENREVLREAGVLSTKDGSDTIDVSKLHDELSYGDSLGSYDSVGMDRREEELKRKAAERGPGFFSRQFSKLSSKISKLKPNKGETADRFDNVRDDVLKNVNGNSDTFKNVTDTIKSSDKSAYDEIVKSTAEEAIAAVDDIYGETSLDKSDKSINIIKDISVKDFAERSTDDIANEVRNAVGNNEETANVESTISKIKRIVRTYLSLIITRGMIIVRGSRMIIGNLLSSVGNNITKSYTAISNKFSNFTTNKTPDADTSSRWENIKSTVTGTRYDEIRKKTVENIIDKLTPTKEEAPSRFDSIRDAVQKILSSDSDNIKEAINKINSVDPEAAKKILSSKIEEAIVAVNEMYGKTSLDSSDDAVNTLKDLPISDIVNKTVEELLKDVKNATGNNKESSSAFKTILKLKGIIKAFIGLIISKGMIVLRAAKYILNILTKKAGLNKDNFGKTYNTFKDYYQSGDMKDDIVNGANFIKTNAQLGAAKATNAFGTMHGMADLYLPGQESPVITIRDMLTKRYYNHAGQPITKCSDIVGLIKDAEGNVVVKEEDIEKLVDKNGTPATQIEGGILKGMGGKLNQMLGKNITGYFTTSAILKGAFKAFNFLQRNIRNTLGARDLYLGDQDRTLVFTAKGTLLGHYRNAIDGSLVRSVDDIKSDVVDNNGDVVLKYVDWKQYGLFDKYGSPVKTGYFRRLLSRPARVLRRVKGMLGLGKGVEGRAGKEPVDKDDRSSPNKERESNRGNTWLKRIYEVMAWNNQTPEEHTKNKGSFFNRLKKKWFSRSNVTGRKGKGSIKSIIASKATSPLMKLIMLLIPLAGWLFKDLPSMFFKGIKWLGTNLIKGVWKLGKFVVSGIKNVIGGLLKNIPGLLKTAFNYGKTAVSTAAGAFGNAAKWTAGKAVDAGKWLGSKAVDAGKATWNVTKNAATTTARVTKDAVKTVATKTVSLAKNTGSAIAEFGGKTISSAATKRVVAKVAGKVGLKIAGRLAARVALMAFGPVGAVVAGLWLAWDIGWMVYEFFKERYMRKLKLVLYGVKIHDEPFAKVFGGKVSGFEMALGKLTRIDPNSGEVTIDDIDPIDYSNFFLTDPSDFKDNVTIDDSSMSEEERYEFMDLFVEWYTERFLPNYKLVCKAKAKFAPDEDMSDLDDMKDGLKPIFARYCLKPQEEGLLDCTTIPFTYNTQGGSTYNYVANYVDEINKEFASDEESLRKKEANNVGNTEEGWFSSKHYGYFEEEDKQKAEAKQKEYEKTPEGQKELAKKKAEEEKIKNMSNGAASFIMGPRLPGTGINTKVDTFDMIKYKTYGMTEMYTDTIGRILDMEKSVFASLEYEHTVPKFNSDLVDQFVNSYANSMAGAGEEPKNNWRMWFLNRFIPTFLTLVASFKNASSTLTITTYKDRLTNEGLYKVAKDVSGAVSNTEKGPVPVWQIDYPFDIGNDINTNPDSVKDLLKLLDSKIKRELASGSALGWFGDTGKKEEPKLTKDDNTFFDNLKSQRTSNNADVVSRTFDPSQNKRADTLDIKEAETYDVEASGAGGDRPNANWDEISRITNSTSAQKRWELIKPLIAEAAKRVGIDPAFLVPIANSESGFNPNAKAPSSTAGGLFQFTDGTWDAYLKKYGPKHGLAPNTSKFDPWANAVIGAELIKENSDTMSKFKGSKATVGDAYLAHFLGPGGARKFITAMNKDPNAAAAANGFSKEANANKTIFFHKTGQARTFAEIYQMITSDKLNTTDSINKINDLRSTMGMSNYELKDAGFKAPPMPEGGSNKEGFVDKIFGSSSMGGGYTSSGGYVPSSTIKDGVSTDGTQVGGSSPGGFSGSMNVGSQYDSGGKPVNAPMISGFWKHHPIPGHGGITSRFSPARVHPNSGVVKPHKGTDLKASIGTPVHAPAAGKVIISQLGTPAGGAGNFIKIDHGSGYATRYLHLDKRVVSAGDQVEAGQIIAYSGNTGIGTGPHLHFEVYYKEEAIDPEKAIPDLGKRGITWFTGTGQEQNQEVVTGGDGVAEQQASNSTSVGVGGASALAGIDSDSGGKSFASNAVPGTVYSQPNPQQAAVTEQQQIAANTEVTGRMDNIINILNNSLSVLTDVRNALSSGSNKTQSTAPKNPVDFTR